MKTRNKIKILLGILFFFLWIINHYAIPKGEKIAEHISPDGVYVLEVYQMPHSIFTVSFMHSDDFKEYFVVLKKKAGEIVAKPGYWINCPWGNNYVINELDSHPIEWDMKKRTVSSATAIYISF